MTSKDLKNKKIYADLHLEISSEEIKERIEQIVSEDSVFGEKELILFVENYVEKHLVYTILSELKISIK
jgi:hypothetical protein